MRRRLLVAYVRAVTTITVVAASLFNAAPARCMVVSTTLAEIAASSDLVVVGRVSKVESVGAGPVATMQVREVWKGQAAPEIRYDVRRAWTCDVSDAQVGEISVVFLVGDAPSGALVLAHSGRGRFPIEVMAGTEYIRARSDGLVLPVELPVEWRAGVDGTFGFWVKLAHLREYVKAKTRTGGQSNEPPNNRLKLTARGRSGADARLRTRAAA